MQVVIRADGSHELGLGHLVRSSTLARELHNRGHDVTFVTLTGPQTAEVSPNGVRLHEIDANSPPETPTWQSSLEPDVVITDGDRFGTDYWRRLRTSVETLATIVDDARTTISADVVVNGNIYAKTLSYDWDPPEPEFCLGLDYLLLRESFSTLANETPPWREPAERALVIMGGVDKENRTPKAIRAFDSTDITVTAVVGPEYENEAEVRRTAREVSTEVGVFKDPDNLAEIMFESDFAVCTLGTVVYELIATQTPIIGIQDNQTPIDSDLAERGLALVLDWHTSASEIETKIDELLSDPVRRKKMWTASSGLITGDGPANIVSVLEDVFSKS